MPTLIVIGLTIICLFLMANDNFKEGHTLAGIVLVVWAVFIAYHVWKALTKKDY